MFGMAQYAACALRECAAHQARCEDPRVCGVKLGPNSRSGEPRPAIARASRSNAIDSALCTPQRWGSSAASSAPAVRHMLRLLGARPRLQAGVIHHCSIYVCLLRLPRHLLLVQGARWPWRCAQLASLPAWGGVAKPTVHFSGFYQRLCSMERAWGRSQPAIKFCRSGCRKRLECAWGWLASMLPSSRSGVREKFYARPGAGRQTMRHQARAHMEDPWRSWATLEPLEGWAAERRCPRDAFADACGGLKSGKLPGN